MLDVSSCFLGKLGLESREHVRDDTLDERTEKVNEGKRE